MSTRGCFGVQVNGRRHFIWSDNDSYPDALGQWLVQQIREADLPSWKRQAEWLRPTASDSELSQDEIDHILKWLNGHSVTLTKDDAESIAAIAPCWMCFDGRDLAEMVEPCLRHEPRRFWRLVWGNLGVLLSLGLYPPARLDWIRGPFCEWVYVLDLDRTKFRVGRRPAADDSRRDLDGKEAGPQNDPRFHFLASFPAAAIPGDWLEIACRRWEEDTDTASAGVILAS